MQELYLQKGEQMKQKSHHEHLIEERENASQALDKAKSQESDKAKIYLNDMAHTIILVKRSQLASKKMKLEKSGIKIKRIL